MVQTTTSDVIGRLRQLRRASYGDPLTISCDDRFLALTMLPRERTALSAEGRVMTADGVWILMVGSTVAVIDTASGSVREPFAGTSWSACWSPTAPKLAAYVQHDGFLCLGVWDADRDEVTLHRNVRVRAGWPGEVPLWTPDGQRVIVRVWPAGEGPAPLDQAHVVQGDEVRLARYSHVPGEAITKEDDGGVLAQWLAGRLCAVDAVTGEVAVLTTATALIGPISPCGDALVTPRTLPDQDPGQLRLYNLTIQPLDGTAPRTVASAVAYTAAGQVSWSPDGQWLAYTTTSGHVPERLWIVPADGSAPPRELTTEPGRLDPGGPPRWTADGRSAVDFGLGMIRVYSLAGESHEIAMPEGFRFRRALQSPHSGQIVAAPDGRWPIVAAPSATWSNTLALVDPASWAVEVVAELEGQWPSSPGQVARSADGATCYVVSEAANRPEECWSVDLRSRETRRVAAFNPSLAGGWGPARVIDWQGADGEPRQGALLLPPQWSGEPLPVICCLYEGRHAPQVMRFGLGDAGMVHGQALAAHGYAVFWPDIVQGESGVLATIAEEVTAGAQALIDQGLADPERLGVMGQSCGGYCTMAVLTRSSLFRAGVAVAGISDITRCYTHLCDDGSAHGIGWCEGGVARIGGTLWERPDAYLENSPLHHFDQVTAPLLLIHGANDYCVPADQSRAAFTALRRLNQRVELLVYHREGHVPTHWREPNYRDFCERVIAWFDEHLARATAP